MKTKTRKLGTLGGWALGGITGLVLCASAFADGYHASQTAITINDNSRGSPYPSVIDLSNSNIVGTLEKVTVTIGSLKHDYANDVGLLLVGPGGQSVVLMNNAGYGLPINGATITFDTGAQPIPQFGGIVSGTFAPGDYSQQSFFPPAPAAPYGSLTDFTQAGMKGKWSLYVQDDQPQSAGSIDSWSIDLETTPLVSVATNRVPLAENGTPASVNFSVQDSSPPSAGYTLRAINSATNLVTASFTMNGLNGTVVLTPKPNAYGTNVLTLVIDEGLGKVQTDVTVELAFANQSPTIAITNGPVATIPGVLSSPVNLMVRDVDNAAADLILTVTSSAPEVVSPAGVSFSPADTGALRKFTVVPNGAATGSATLTFTVKDPAGLTNSATLAVNVSPAGHPLAARTNIIDLADSTVTNSTITVSNVPGKIARATIALNGLKGVHPETLGLALEAPGGKLSLLKASDVTGPKNYAQLVFADDGGAFPSGDAYLSTVVAPADPLSALLNSNPNGTWKLWVTNGGAGAQITGGWVLNLYIAPIITSSVTTVSMPEEASTNISFTITSPNGSITNASSVTFTSGDPSLLKIAGNNFDIATGNGWVQVQALFDAAGTQYGTNTITLTVRDNNNFVSSYTFNVWVTFVNHVPLIGFVPKQTTYAGVPVGPVTVPISDIDLPAQSLTLSASSDNQKLLPDSNIVLGGTGKNRTATLFPVGATAGTARVTLTVNDGRGGATSTTFDLVVQGPGNPLFANLNQIDVPANALAKPSTNLVQNLIGTISGVQVSLFDITHTLAENINVLLVSPQGRKVLLMGHAGGSTSLNGTTLIFDDAATDALPQGQIASGVYKPTQYEPNATFPAPAPAVPYDTTLAAFNGLSGTNANGAWVLYVMDDGLGKGTIVNGWQLSIRTTPSVQQIADQTLRENEATRTVAVTLGDNQPGVDITVNAVSADSSIVKVAVQPGSGASRNLDITPVAYRFGSNITVTVSAQIGSDASTKSETSFLVTVYQVDLPPVVSGIADLTTTRATPVSTSFTAWDPQDKSLQPVITSSDSNLVPQGNISVSTGTLVNTTNGHNIYRYDVSILPAGALSGETTLTATVSDSVKQSTVVKFNLTVNEGGPLFANSDGPIAIPTGYPLASNATPYPSVIHVANLDGFVTGVEVTLIGFAHDYPQDVSVLLVSPNNQKAVVLMAHAGGTTPVADLRLTFDQASENVLPQNSSLSSGTYAPGDFAAALKFAPDAPASGYTTNLDTFAGISPNGDWKLYVMDTSVGASGSIGSWLLALETSPAVAAIGPQTTLENTPKVIDVDLLSQSVDPATLTATVSSSGDAPADLKWSLIKNLTITNKSGAHWVLTIVPADNLPSAVTNVNGSVNIHVHVTDGNVVNTTTFPLTIVYADQPPTVATAARNIYFSEGSSASFDFLVSDIDSPLYTSNIVVLSADPNLVPNTTDNIHVSASTNRFLKGETGTVSVRVTPATPYTFGTNTLSFAISDGVSFVTNTVTLNVAHIYQAPVITGLPATNTIAAASSTIPIPFTVSSPEGVSPKNLNVRATSSDQNLVPDSNILLFGAGSADRTIQLTPLGAASGSTRITLTIDDAKATNQFSFWLVVQPPPAGFYGNGQLVAITNTANQPYPLTFEVANLVGSISKVTVELRGLTHNNPGNLDVLLVSPEGIPVMLMSGAGGTEPVSGIDLVFDDNGPAMSPTATLVSGTNHPAFYTVGKRLLPEPAPQAGYAGNLSALEQATAVNGTWKLFVSDLTTGDSGKITGGCFLGITTTPAIQVVTASPYVIPENGSMDIHFTVSDSMGPVTNLTVTGASDNKGLLPASPPNLVIRPEAPGVNNNFTAFIASLQPLPFQYGTLNLTLQAASTDGRNASVSVPVTVTGTNIPPVVYRILPQTTPATKPITVPILVSDIDTPLAALSIKAVSLNQAIIGTSNLVFAASETNVLDGIPDVDGLGQALLNIKPNLFSSGDAAIELTVTDPKKGVGTNYVVAQFTVTVATVIYDPTITSISAQSLTAGTTSLPIGFSVNSANAGDPNLTVTATSSDQSLVKDANIVLNPASAGSGARTVQLTAEPKVRGNTTIRLTVRDTVNNRSASTEFVVTIVPTPEHNYVNSKQILINDHGSATPYPSTIDVNDLSGTIKSVSVSVNNFNHSYPADVGLLLVAPSGKKLVLMNKAGGGIATSNVSLTFDAGAASAVPQGSALSTGTYKPADWKVGAYDFPPNAPVHPYSTNLNDLVGTSPAGTWSLYAVDDTVNDAGVISGGWTLSIITQPLLLGLTNITIPENQTGSMPFALADDSPSGPSFHFGIASGDTTLLPKNNISVTAVGGSGTNFTISITPALNRFGTNTVTLFATNIDNFVASSTFTVKVPFVLQPPTITLATNQYWTAAGTVADIPLDYGDVQLPKNQLLVSFDSSNPNLVPLTGIQLVTDSGGATHIRVQPFGALDGSSLITVRVSQPNNGLATSSAFTLNVAPVHNLFGSGGTIVINDFSAATPYPSSINVENSEGHILRTTVRILGLQHAYPRDISIVLVGPQGQKVVLMSGVSNGDPATNVDLTFDSTASTSLPAGEALATGTYKPTCYNAHLALATNNVPGPYLTNLNAFTGTSPVGAWSLYVQDDARQDAGIILNGWLLSFVTDAPILPAIAAQVTDENTPLTLNFSVDSVVVDPSKLTVTATASQENPPLLVGTGLAVTGPGTNAATSRTLRINPGLNLPSSVMDSNGTALITLSATDGTNTSSTSFPLTVRYINQAPTIVGLSDTNTPANAAVSWGFTAADVDTPADSLLVTVSNSAPELGALSQITNGNSHVLTFVPKAVAGEALVTVTVSDGQLNATRTVHLSVLPAIPPVLGEIEPQTTVANQPAIVQLSVSDAVTSITNLQFSGTSSNPALVTDVTFAGLVATVHVAENQIGTADISITATDPFGISASTTFTLTVTAPTPPVIAEIADQQTKANLRLIVGVSVTDSGIPLSAMNITASHTNSVLLSGPPQVSNNGTNVNLVITPALNQIGTDYITVTADDGFTPVSRSFLLTVVPPVAPEIESIDDQGASAGSTFNVTLRVTSPDTAITNLVFSGTSTNHELVNVPIAFSFNGTNEVATITLAAGKSGDDRVTLCVSDPFATNCVSFNLHVSPIEGPRLALTIQGDQVKITFSGSPHASYTVQATADLTRTWTDIGTVTADDNGAAEYSASLTAGSGAQFFRAQVK